MLIQIKKRKLKKLSFIKNLEIFDYQNYNKIPKLLKIKFL